MLVWELQIKLHLNIMHRTFLRDDDLYRLHKSFYYPSFYIINYEYALKHLEWLVDTFGFEAIILDEGHRIRRPTGKTSKVIREHTEYIQYKLLLTGTPIGKKFEDLWAQITWLNKNIWDPCFDSFAIKYLRRTGYQKRDYVVKPKWKKYLLNKIKPFTYSVEKRAVLKHSVKDIPVPFDLCRKVRKHYDRIETELATEVLDYGIDLDLAIQKTSVLQQLTGGFLSHTEEDILLELEQDKLVVLLDLLHDLPEKVVIFCHFKHEVERICQALTYIKRPYVKIKGSYKGNDEAWQRFQKEKDLTTIVVQNQAGGIGIDLFAASIGIYYSLTYDPVVYEQTRGRVDRSGQLNNVIFYHILARNTVDYDKYISLTQSGFKLGKLIKHFKRRVKHGKKSKAA